MTDTFSNLAALITAAPTSYHAAAEVARQLEAAGFTRLHEADAWQQQPGGYVLVRDGAVLAWRIPEPAEGEDARRAPVRLIGAHTDSPGFRIKPATPAPRHGWQTLAVEVYGGPLLNSWLDRDLRIGARLVRRDGSTALVTTGPIARIPQLAVHLNRSVNAEGLKLDPQLHTHPVLGLEGCPSLASILAAANRAAAALGTAADLTDDDIVGLDAFVTDAQPPARLGASGEFIAAGRLDNLVSVYVGMQALLAAHAPRGYIPMLAAFDHEEVGSESRTGAAGPLLADVFARIRTALGATAEDAQRANAASWSISSDVGHAVHPNYADHHDEDVQPRSGGGPILKINANQRYTTDGRGEALWRTLSEAAGVPVQAFVSRNSIPSGSTIGPISATRLGLATVDVGIPILSMHSARELAALADIDALTSVLTEFLTRIEPLYQLR